MISYTLAIEMLKQHEGSVSYMYLDTNGFVTVGVGNLLSSAAEAKGLAFVNRKTGGKATEEEIQKDYDNVKKQQSGKLYTYYKQFTELDLPSEKINDLLTRKIKNFENSLRSNFPKWDSYSEDSQIALLDMIFNLGPHGLTTKFPTLKKAIENEDWSTAAKECNRPDVNLERNTKIKGLFESAAKQKAAVEKKTVEAKK